MENELIRSQRKAIQIQLDKLKKETNVIKKYMINEELDSLYENLREMLNPKSKQL